MLHLQWQYKSLGENTEPTTLGEDHPPLNLQRLSPSIMKSSSFLSFQIAIQIVKFLSFTEMMLTSFVNSSFLTRLNHNSSMHGLLAENTCKFTANFISNFTHPTLGKSPSKLSISIWNGLPQCHYGGWDGIENSNSGDCRNEGGSGVLDSKEMQYKHYLNIIIYSFSKLEEL